MFLGKQGCQDVFQLFFKLLSPYYPEWLGQLMIRFLQPRNLQTILKMTTLFFHVMGAFFKWNTSHSHYDKRGFASVNVFLHFVVQPSNSNSHYKCFLFYANFSTKSHCWVHLSCILSNGVSKGFTGSSDFTTERVARVWTTIVVEPTQHNVW